MMRIKMVLKTSVSFIHLMRLIVQEDFIELSNYVDTYHNFTATSVHFLGKNDQKTKTKKLSLKSF
jgi:hypothetical protein